MINNVWIVMVCALGSLLSAGAGAMLARNTRGNWLGALVGFAVGALLGVAFLEILPQLLAEPHDVHGAIGSILVGVVVFFVLEKLFVWRHHHGGQWVSEHDAHEINAQPRSAALVLLGNGVHNLFDGVFIAAGFLISTRLGALSAIAIFAHQLAQQFGDARAAHPGGMPAQWLVSVGAGAAPLAGALLALALLAHAPQRLQFVLGMAAASMIYVAMADLIPSLHTRTDSSAAMQQLALIGLGVAAILISGALIS